MRIALVTDAWLPQTNGVVRTLTITLVPAPRPIWLYVGLVAVEKGIEDFLSLELAALNLDRRACREHALRYTWEAATRQFVASLAPVARATRSSVNCPSAATRS
ncbi:MAG: hypothetical protein NTU56_08835 [Proteobacteria bacterium]|nr:hypothetical protein [Pseudomonadota bacterium]